jgi:oxygen-independent coproporphyrinogen III oxidase
MEGVSLTEFATRFGVTVEATFGPVIERYTRLGLLETVDGRLRLTDRGLLLSNEVFTELLPDPDED